MTWNELTKWDRGEWNLLKVDLQDKQVLRTRVKNAASQLAGTGPTDMGDTPASAQDK